jgi:hypothetical protein
MSSIFLKQSAISVMVVSCSSVAVPSPTGVLPPAPTAEFVLIVVAEMDLEPRDTKLSPARGWSGDSARYGRGPRRRLYLKVTGRGLDLDEAGSCPTDVKRLKHYKFDDEHTMAPPLLITIEVRRSHRLPRKLTT